MNKLLQGFKNNYKVAIPAILIVVAVLGVIAQRQLNKSEVSVLDDGQPKQVKVMTLKSLKSDNRLELEGVVKPATKVDVTALANGTVKSLNFKVGDKVGMNQALGYVADDALAASYANSSVSYSNIAQNTALTKALTDEGIRQASLGIDRAKEVMDQAQIGLDTAKQNLANAKSLQERGKEDLRTNALVAQGNYLNVVNSALDQIDYVIIADGSGQIEGISDTLSAKNLQALPEARQSYAAARDAYRRLAAKKYSPAEASLAIREATSLLALAKSAVDDTIVVLDSTISSIKFSESLLNMQRTAFVSVRANVVSTLSAAQANKQSLDNVDLINKRELDGLTAAVKNAENQVKQARLGYDNAKLALNNSKQSQSQQVLLSKSSLDNARGQLNLVGTQLSDLTIKAPIAGQVTAKSVELGAEVRIGQKLAEISQTNMVKVVLNLSPDDAELIKLGQKATVNGKLAGTVSNINPSADIVNKKVAVEVVVENKDKLVPETLAKVTFSTADNPLAKQQYKVPLSAVTVAQNESFIFIAGSSTAQKVGVELLEVDGDWATVKVALPGDVKVVIEGNKNLSDGSKIEIK